MQTFERIFTIQRRLERQDSNGKWHKITVKLRSICVECSWPSRGEFFFLQHFGCCRKCFMPYSYYSVLHVVYSTILYVHPVLQYYYYKYSHTYCRPTGSPSGVSGEKWKKPINNCSTTMNIIISLSLKDVFNKCIKNSSLAIKHIYIHIMQIFLSCLKLRAAPFILDKKLLNKEICSWPWSGSGATFFDVAALVAF